MFIHELGEDVNWNEIVKCKHQSFVSVPVNKFRENYFPVQMSFNENNFWLEISQFKKLFLKGFW